MLDTRLPLKAKAIYAYFCSFAGSGNAAFPKTTTIVQHLNITEKTYYKFFRILLDANYITAVQRYIDGRFSINDYYLNSNPNAEITAKKLVVATKNQTGNFSDTQEEQPEIQTGNFSDTQKQDTQKQDTQISDTNINRIRINNFNKNQSINQQAAQPPYPAEPDEIERLSDEEYIEKIEDELTAAGTLQGHY